MIKMPYLSDRKDRKTLDAIIDVHKELLAKPGSVNYLLFKLAKELCSRYQHYRNFLGEIESAKLEIYRRQVGEYEDEKIQENGDVD